MKKVIILFIFSLYFLQISAQDTRTQYPPFLTNLYFEINIGYINYPFTSLHMETGYEVDNIEIPHTAVRIIPFGYNFNKFLSAQISYMRPVLWVRYNNVKGDNYFNNVGDGHNHPVFMNIGGVSLKGQYPIKNKLKLYAEAGMSVVTRSGFQEDKNLEIDIVKDVGYATLLFGAGLKYRVNEKWTLQVGTTYSPANEPAKQPYSIFHSAGFSFNLAPLPEEVVQENVKSGYIFPKNMIQVGYSTNAFGYGINNFLSEGKIPVFWGGYAEVEKGITLHYQQNVFHGKKIFSLDWGTSFSFWQSDIENTKFWTLSLFPVLRFSFLHTKPFDMYLNYSLAGPTYISANEHLDNRKTGPHFTFQDFMGLGMYMGKNRNINAEVRIAHYSNGNLFPQNEGVKIPLTFNLGYAF